MVKPKKIIVTTFIATSALILTVFSFKLALAYNEVKDYDLSLIEKPTPSIVYDRKGNEITKISDGQVNREWESNIPEKVKKAFISIEDKRFYEHSGIDYLRLIKVSFSRLVGKNSGGASTITQQLVKNLFLTPERTIDRKLKEIVLSKMIENRYSKEKILESYLNNIYFGNGNHGIKMASKDYFSKELKDLSVRESAMLASVINNPNWYDLRKSMYKTQNMSMINNRTNLCIYLMNKNGYISESQKEKAYDDGVFINKNKTYYREYKMYDHAHFTEYAINDASKVYLLSKGINPTNKRIMQTKKMFAKKGFKIYTSLDTDLQNHLESTVQNYRYPKLIDGSDVEASCVISENKTGKIVAMVGSRNNPVNRWTYNRAVQSYTPVASILKPLAIYGPAYSNGKNLDDMVLNEKTKIDGYDDDEPYPPGKLLKEGPVTYQFSLDHSLNIPAGRILVEDVGYDKCFEYLHKLGINDYEIIKSGQGIVLGTSGIPIIKILRGYQAIANDGVYIEQSSIDKICDSNDNVVATPNSKKTRVYTSEGSEKLRENLRSVVTNGSGYACNIDDVKISGKTGTHEDKVFNFAGFSEKYSGVVWMASDKNISFRGQKESQDTASPLFAEIFSYFKGENNTDDVIIN